MRDEEVYQKPVLLCWFCQTCWGIGRRGDRNCKEQHVGGLVGGTEHSPSFSLPLNQFNGLWISLFPNPHCSPITPPLILQPQSPPPFLLQCWDHQLHLHQLSSPYLRCKQKTWCKIWIHREETRNRGRNKNFTNEFANFKQRQELEIELWSERCAKNLNYANIRLPFWLLSTHRFLNTPLPLLIGKYHPSYCLLSLSPQTIVPFLLFSYRR